MSDEIPFHIQEEIMKRLPVKSVIRFRSVSKAWKSLIDSSQFISAHSLLSHTQTQHLLVSCQEYQEEGKYVCYIDDETFPHQRSLPTLPPPLSTKQIFYPKVVGSSRGLVCLHGTDCTSMNDKALLWNPLIRKLIIIDLPDIHDNVGFGVCPVTNDPKILSITQSPIDVTETSYTCEVMIYTLSSGIWRSLTIFPAIGIQSLYSTVITDQFIYWRADQFTYGDVWSQIHSMIMSFDVTSESFEAIDLPDSLAHHDREDLDITKLRESLAILHYNRNIGTVWMMEHRVKRSLFTKLFNIITSSPKDNILGFRKNGIPIMRVTDADPDDGDYNKPATLVVYEPTSNHNNILEISSHIFRVKSYMETLLLLGRSNCISY